MTLKREIKRWRANFGTGLAVVLPSVIAIWIFTWLSGIVLALTNKFVFWVNWLPTDFHKMLFKEGEPEQGLYWWWSLLALILAILAVTIIGKGARYYIGRKIIALVDYFMLKVPLLNRIYSAVKQVNEALTTKNQSSFKQVVLVEFPSRGMYSIGFITGERHEEVTKRLNQPMVSVFVSTTPNPTTGFLAFFPREKVIKLDMSVADGIRYIISLGAVSPPHIQKGVPNVIPADGQPIPAQFAAAVQSLEEDDER